VRLYTLRKREICQHIQKRVSNICSAISDGNKGCGYAIGFWYFMNISITTAEYGDQYSIWLIATAASYEALTKDKEDDEDDCSDPLISEKTELAVFERTGSFSNIWYKERKLKITSMTPRPNQDVIIQRIKEHTAANGHTVAYLYGPPGSGKSIIAVLLANSYNAIYCNTCRPWQPGDTLAYMYSEAAPTEDKPLIIAFDEFDEALLEIHTGINQHKNISIQVANKSGWNQMLDEIHIGMYPHLILILTSNKSPEFIHSLDPSYIRAGRVDLTFEVV
jgi:hypothetical protein